MVQGALFKLWITLNIGEEKTNTVLESGAQRVNVHRQFALRLQDFQRRFHHSLQVWRGCVRPVIGKFVRLALAGIPGRRAVRVKQATAGAPKVFGCDHEPGRPNQIIVRPLLKVATVGVRFALRAHE